jgi:hypothetical protein
MGIPDFKTDAATRLQSFTVRCQWISISHNNVSVKLNQAEESLRASACRMPNSIRVTEYTREVRGTPAVTVSAGSIRRGK